MAQYKTIVRELIQENEELHERLRQSRQLLATVNHHAGLLKGYHEDRMVQLLRAKRGSDLDQISSEALELAIQDLRDRLPSASQPDEAEPLSLDAAMSFIRRPSPPA